ncbi:TIGR03619 family F420-dependent LLM class oxidoreductase [Jongsikchunia kroppenstedtii]|uniref:TIGR03619 family F420-dependent LLM class oxidoreductase n=1 Tax=Jongsikchunia kroppenstedtii TaxID=1121721 RepID=UPI000375E0D8|nr:TIGR03619 family F420-dependent LLM class oxidoreductase [Jongsikchunia kroppenstedtii]
MRIGVMTPVVTAVPGQSADWEVAAGSDDLIDIAGTADHLGFDHLTCSEHVAVPASAEGRGTTYWDPLATLSFLAAATHRIRLATAVLVLPYHRPIELAKRYGTLDRLSGGRLILGVGVGSLREEFDLLGAPWPDRGTVADERLAELRDIWGRTDVGGMIVSPAASSTQVPIWVGGRTGRSLRRAVSLGDGWMPFGLSLAQITEMLSTTTASAGFDVVLTPSRPLDPLGDPTGTETALRRLRDAGATVASVRISAHSTAHYCDQLDRLSRSATELEQT